MLLYPKLLARREAMAHIQQPFWEADDGDDAYGYDLEAQPPPVPARRRVGVESLGIDGRANADSRGNACRAAERRDELPASRPIRCERLSLDQVELDRRVEMGIALSGHDDCGPHQATRQDATAYACDSDARSPANDDPEQPDCEFDEEDCMDERRNCDGEHRGDEEPRPRKRATESSRVGNNDPLRQSQCKKRCREIFETASEVGLGSDNESVDDAYTDDSASLGSDLPARDGRASAQKPANPFDALGVVCVGCQVGACVGPVDDFISAYFMRMQDNALYKCAEVVYNRRVVKPIVDEGGRAPAWPWQKIMEHYTMHCCDHRLARKGYCQNLQAMRTIMEGRMVTTSVEMSDDGQEREVKQVDPALVDRYLKVVALESRERQLLNGATNTATAASTTAASGAGAHR